ncbi:hypothetical protein B0T16DRAFT_396019 [Cercophora newfieldiana]|uniref:Uncharacterized protein n=1 Tax=Cercophora newfieldiana TaxID=92897 RepID=A0AA39YNT1_9PEZI|nr:hypothetical protein B0T16DRAFT_396019 [Cercophora newfieldiana]
MRSMAQTQSRFLGLPRELRDQIYEDYLFTNDGYAYDYEAGKLRMADGRPIDLGLTYACRRTACEMQGVALRVNTVVFSTLYNNELRTRAARWQWIIDELDCSSAPYYALKYMGQESFERAVLALGDCGFAKRCVRRRPVVASERAYLSGGAYGEVPSTRRQARNQFVRAALADPDVQRYFDDEANATWAYRVPGYMAHLLDAAEREPWSIPTEDELDEYAWRIPNKEPLRDQPSPRDRAFWRANGSKARFSAVAAAIHFLNSSPASLRQQLRNIVVHEDRMSVNGPASHVQGLIPFCVENPALRIERRVDLWRNCFASCASGDFPLHPESFLALRVRLGDPMTAVSADLVTRPVALWMVEASLPFIPETITLVLDGGPSPEQMSHVFQEAVQRDAAWQIALDRVTGSPGYDPDKRLWSRGSSAYLFEGFPELLESIRKKEPGCRVSCNFYPGDPWTDEQIDEIAEANKDNDDTWAENMRRPELAFTPPPPLPDFHSLREEYVLEDSWVERHWEMDIEPWRED